MAIAFNIGADDVITNIDGYFYIGRKNESGQLNTYIRIDENNILTNAANVEIGPLKRNEFGTFVNDMRFPDTGEATFGDVLTFDGQNLIFGAPGGGAAWNAFSMMFLENVTAGTVLTTFADNNTFAAPSNMYRLEVELTIEDYSDSGGNDQLFTYQYLDARLIRVMDSSVGGMGERLALVGTDADVRKMPGAVAEIGIEVHGGDAAFDFTTTGIDLKLTTAALHDYAVAKGRWRLTPGDF